MLESEFAMPLQRLSDFITREVYTVAENEQSKPR